MKKSILAVSIVAVASATSAATVYDKDGTSLSVGGRVQAVAYNGHARKAGDEDATLLNSARLNIGGKTKVNDLVTVFAFTEWDASNGNTHPSRENFTARDQYVGADFGAYGSLKAGKFQNITYVAQAATDVFEEYGAASQGTTNNDRRSGNIRYDYNGYGFNASASYQMASDNQHVLGEANIHNGYALGLGYTFDNVVFGPLSIQVGYDHVKGQVSDRGVHSNNFKHVSTSIAWGDINSGLYLAALYDSYKYDYVNEYVLGKANYKNKGS